jgi:hypothetical protein
MERRDPKIKGSLPDRGKKSRKKATTKAMLEKKKRKKKNQRRTMTVAPGGGNTTCPPLPYGSTNVWPACAGTGSGLCIIECDREIDLEREWEE